MMKKIILVLMVVSLCSSFVHRQKMGQKQRSPHRMKIIDKTGHIKMIDYDDSPPQKPAECNIHQHQYYQICETLKSCDLCSAVHYCGWCGKSQKCLPGSTEMAVCPDDCVNGWIFQTWGCRTQMVYGNITNIQPDSVRLVNAQITEPKTHIRYFKDKVYKNNELTQNNIEIEVGHSKHHESTYYRNGDYEINHKTEFSNPIKGEFDNKFAVTYKSDDYYFDQQGIHLNAQQEKVNHGLDTRRRRRRRR